MNQHIELKIKSQDMMDRVSELHVPLIEAWRKEHGIRRRKYGTDIAFYSIRYTVDVGENEMMVDIAIVPAMSESQAILTFIGNRIDKLSPPNIVDRVNEGVAILHRYTPLDSLDILSVAEVPREMVKEFIGNDPYARKLLDFS